MKNLPSTFDRIAHGTAHLAGRPVAFISALALIAAWALAGPRTQFSDTWQLIINTGTTIVTFLMVFLIQHTQNRESVAIRLKLDELIRAMDAADDRLLGADDMDEAELERLRVMYENLAECAREKMSIKASRRRALDSPPVAVTR